MKILLIEDDSRLVLALYNVLSASYKIETVQTGRAGVQKACDNLYDAIILDLHLPDVTGLRVCEEIRSNSIQTPILVLSGEMAIDSKVALLDSGANDYLTKPFSPQELEARLRTVIRTSPASRRHPRRLVVGTLVMDTLERRVYCQEQEIPLTRKEFAILECLMGNAGTVVSRDEVARCVWEDGWPGKSNTIDVHIKYLRDKLDRRFKASYIKTIRGFGYKIDISKVASG